MKGFQSFILLIGRVAMSFIFLFAAYQKITHWDSTIHEMVARNIPETSIALFLACMLEFLGAISLIMGYKVRWAAGALALFLIPTTILFHNFWDYSGAEGYMQTLMFLKNLALFGGLLHVATIGAGAFSIDRS